MVKEVNATDTSGLVKITVYDAKIKDIEDKIPSITNLTTTTTTLNAVWKKNTGRWYSSQKKIMITK